MSSHAFLNVMVYAALVVMAAVFVILEAGALRNWRGVWRIAAIAPAMVVGWIALGVLLEPAAHSLWPIELILWLVPAIIALAIARILLRAAERMHRI